MKVLMQAWQTSQGREYSISKGRSMLDATIKSPTDGEDTPLGEAHEVEIPDDHGLAKMVEEGTVFLCPDEMILITY